MEDKPVVIQSEHLADSAAQWLNQRCRLWNIQHDEAGFAEAIAKADGLVVRTYTIVDEALLRRATKLRVVGRAGVGLDNIDVPACRKRGIEVVYTPDSNTQAVVEYVFGLICDAIRPRAQVTTSIGAAEWNRLRSQTVGQRQMNELTLGILGFGRIGRRIAQIAGAFGVRTLFNDLLEIPDELHFGAVPTSVQSLFEQSDVLSIHIDGRTSNRRFIGRELINKMRNDVLFINTSRGFVVDNIALGEFLVEHAHAEARLDVHEPEPIDESYPLLSLPNAKLYPHLAGRTEQAMLNMSWVVRDVWAVLEGREPRSPAP